MLSNNTGVYGISSPNGCPWNESLPYPRKGDKIILVASKFAGRYYVVAGGQWSTQDAAVIAKCRQVILRIAA